MFRTVFGANPFGFFLASMLEKPSCKVRLFVQNRSRKYRPKVTITTLFQTVSHPAFQLLSQTAHVRSHSRKWVHTRPSEKNCTQRLTRRSRGVSDGGCCHSRHEPHVSKPPLAGYQNGKLCRFCVLVRCTPEARRRRGPAGLRDLFLLLSKLQLARPALRAFCVCEVGVASLPSVCSACCQSVPCAGVKTANLPISEVG